MLLYTINFTSGVGDELFKMWYSEMWWSTEVSLSYLIALPVSSGWHWWFGHQLLCVVKCVAPEHKDIPHSCLSSVPWSCRWFWISNCGKTWKASIGSVIKSYVIMKILFIRIAKVTCFHAFEVTILISYILHIFLCKNINYENTWSPWCNWADWKHVVSSLETMVFVPFTSK